MLTQRHQHIGARRQRPAPDPSEPAAHDRQATHKDLRHGDFAPIALDHAALDAPGTGLGSRGAVATGLR